MFDNDYFANIKVGIGRITMGRRNLKHIITNGYPGKLLQVGFIDTEKKGVAHSRNVVLKHLYDNGCDEIFLFDDDCYPVMEGWIHYLIEWRHKLDVEFLGMPEPFKGEIVKRPHVFCNNENEIVCFNGLLGCFGLFSRRLIETVGYFNVAYDRYGFEDAGFRKRILKSNCVRNHYCFPVPVRTMAYLHSEDAFAENPEPNLTWEEKQYFIEKNKSIYLKEVNSGQIYYAFNEITDKIIQDVNINPILDNDPKCLPLNN